MPTKAQIEAGAKALHAYRQKELGHDPPNTWADVSRLLKKQANEYRTYAKVAIQAAEKVK